MELSSDDTARVVDAAARSHAIHILETTSDRRSVYFVRVGNRGPIKIGLAKNVDSRVAGLSTGAAKKLVVLGVTAGGGRMELFLHRLFAADRLNGEWFKSSRELRRWMRMLCFREGE